MINTIYRDRPYPRFSELGLLCARNLHETLGWWRKVDWLKVHFAESWIELHYLLIMEELGRAAC